MAASDLGRRQVGLGTTLAALPLRALAWGVVTVPRSWSLALGHALGTCLRALGFRRRVIEENLKIAFPQDESLQRQLRQRFYIHFGKTLVEVLALLGPWRKFSERNSLLFGKEHWKAASDEGKGVLFLASHLGNWELMAASGGLADMNLMMVTKQLKPTWFHQAIESGRLQSNVSGTYEPRTLKDVLRHLKAGKTVGVVLDQYSGPPVGIRVPFLGMKVGTASFLAVIVKRTGARVVPVKSTRRKDGVVEVRIDPAIRWEELPQDPEREIEHNTARYAAILEEHIRSCPEQWLWTHRRFKGDCTPVSAG